MKTMAIDTQKKAPPNCPSRWFGSIHAGPRECITGESVREVRLPTMSAGCRFAKAITAAAALALGVTGCTTIPPTGTAASSGSSLDACASRTRDPGALTIATYDPVYAPWYIGNDPDNGRGFESRLGYKIAQHMGIKPDHVVWQRESFSQIVSPGKKDFDLALAEVSATTDRRSGLTLSAPYGTVQQAVVTVRGSKVEDARSLKQLKGARIAASVQTTSAAAATSVINPDHEVVTYPSIKAAGEALAENKVDALVADLPTADYLADAVLDDGVMLGRLSSKPEPVSGVLSKNSELTDCVDQAITSLRRQGVIDDLDEEWLPDPATTPVLR